MTGKALRRGWTTGACATAATKSALYALLGADFIDPVTITLPKGETPAFALAHEDRGPDWALAGIIKDAGDDPDVTHGALVSARVARGEPGSGIVFHAGDGVGMVTRPGLPIDVGEPAINPVPRSMMQQVALESAETFGVSPDFSITIGVRDGARLAEKTWNPRLGIVGGLSILGTTGIVVPYSCSAWIHSIHRGIDVARAMGLSHVVGSTGDRSEQAARARLGLREEAYLDMGDFVGGMLKYLRQHPVETVTIAGGFAKISKLAQGALDLHSARGTVDLETLAQMVLAAGGGDELATVTRAANTANEALQHARDAGIPLGNLVAEAARKTAQHVLRGGAAVSILVVDRRGAIVGEAGL
ncbi:cobalt-precorrin-5B (C(1))-methyltransferase [Devosia pacifica]|nr:cobalt-precorrin-5B (C(1))-methyltransferase [Devosia pacifica]